MPAENMKPISRREALKAIAAVTGVAVLSSVRNEWKTPLVQVGVLPAHAQASATGNLRVNNNSFGPILVTVPAGAPLTGLATQEIGEEESGTFTLPPGAYEAVAEATGNNCFEVYYFEFTLGTGETVVWDVECEET
jgi:hypothetical protein